MPCRHLLFALLLAHGSIGLGHAAAPTSEPSPSVVAAPAPAAPRLAPLSIDAAISLARAHLADRAPVEADREIVGAQFIPPHGRVGAGFWLIDLAPYPSNRPAPADPFTSLLLAMDGTVEERGGRRALSPDEQKARAGKAASLHRLMRDTTAEKK